MLLEAPAVPRIDPATTGDIALEPLYKVIIHNDDVTPMNFVVRVLVRIFYLHPVQAVEVMYTAHYHGSALVQVLPRQEAHQRVARARFAAALEGYPLRFSVEKE